MVVFEHKDPQHDLDVYNHTLKAVSNNKNDLKIRMAIFNFKDDGIPRGSLFQILFIWLRIMIN